MDQFNISTLRHAVLVVTSITAYQLHAVESGESGETIQAESISAESTMEKPDQVESMQQRLLPPPPPGPYQSMAFKRDASDYRRFRSATTDAYSRPARPVPTGPSARQATVPGVAASKPATSGSSTPSDSASVASQFRSYPSEQERARAAQKMNMYSPDRPWPDDLRPAPPMGFEQRIPGNVYPPARPAKGAVPPYYGDGRNYNGGNYMPRPEYNAPIPPGYWPDMNYQGRNPSEMGRIPSMYNSPGDRTFYPEPRQGR